MSNIVVYLMTIFLLSGIADTNLFASIKENNNSLYEENNTLKIKDDQFYSDCKRVATEKGFVYHNIYPEIDLKIEYSENQTEYDFIIKPFGNIQDIKIAFSDETSSSINCNGDLVVRTKHTNHIHKKPYCFQIINGQITPVKSEFKPLDSRTYGFRVNDYRYDQELIIDPIIIDYSTYLGGVSMDYGSAVTVDDSDSIYVTGSTNSPNFPTFNAYQGVKADISHASYDIFLLKFSKNRLLRFSTYIGGSDDDEPSGMIVDSSNNILITGYTESIDFPTVTAYQKTLNGRDNAFVLKLDNTGAYLDFSTYLGGERMDYGMSINLDESMFIYVGGYTLSNTFPTKNAYQPSISGFPSDGFITKFNNLGTDLVYSTYLGGTGFEYIFSAKTDLDGNVYLTGRTTSEDFPTINAFQLTSGGGYPPKKVDVFVSKLYSSGQSLIYSTYLGGAGNENAYDMIVDDSGSVILCGSTSSPNFPTLNAYQPSKTVMDILEVEGFITKMSPSGTSLIFSTFLGGSGTDDCNALISSSVGNIYVCGSTSSPDFPILGAIYSTISGVLADSFFTIFDTSGKRILFSTYFGGSDDDSFNDLTINSDGKIILIGETTSTDFPTKKAFQKDCKGGSDAVLVTLYTPPDIPIIEMNGLIFLCFIFLIFISYFLSHRI